MENIKNVVHYPERRKQVGRGQHGGFVYTFEKEVDGVTLKVVAEVRAKDCWLITAYEPDPS